MRTVLALATALLVSACGGEEDPRISPAPARCGLTANASLTGHAAGDDFTCIHYYDRDGRVFAHCDVTHADPGVWTCEDDSGNSLTDEQIAAIEICQAVVALALH